MRKIGRYLVIDELGRGATGVVCRCLDPAIGREVAVKTIRMTDPSMAEADVKQSQRLLHEARSAGILNHPAIVTIYDISEENGVAFIAMEFVQGRTLEALLAGGEALGGDLFWSLAGDVADSLDYAHRKGIIHRDIKPANLIVNEHGRVKITDFGIAKITDFVTMTQPGTILGTPFYMSPEQVRGAPVSGQTDQYSLCVIAYEMLTGRRPFEADHLPAMMYKIVREEPVPSQQWNPTLGPEIDAVLRRGLAKEPAGRYSACREFVDALAKACAETPGWRSLPRGGALPSQARTPERAISHAARPMPQAVRARPAEEAVPPASMPLPPPRARPAEELKAQPPLLVPIALLVVAASGYWLSQRIGGGDHSIAKPVVSPAAPAEAGPVRSAGAPEPPAAKASDGPVLTPVEVSPKILAKQPPEPPSAWREVRVRTEPPQALVSLDDLAGAACRTPCTVQADDGSHTITAVLEGYEKGKRSFTVSGQPVDLLITLEKSEASK